MASSSTSFGISIDSDDSREMTPKFDLVATRWAAYDALAPPHWDAEWDFNVWSEDNSSSTEGEDLEFLINGGLEEEDDNAYSWGRSDSSTKDKKGNESSDTDSLADEHLFIRSSDHDEELVNEDFGGWLIQRRRGPRQRRR
jgi:hypothetical protein